MFAVSIERDPYRSKNRPHEYQQFGYTVTDKHVELPTLNKRLRLAQLPKGLTHVCVCI